MSEPVVWLRVSDPHASEPIPVSLSVFEHEVNTGTITPNTQIRFEPITGNAFVRAGDLEFYRDLRNLSSIQFTRYFHLGHFPIITLILVITLLVTYFGWQHHAPRSLDEILEQGGRHQGLIRDTGQWWRLLTSNFLHVDAIHLASNIFFLVNLGGIAESVFRRIDYLLILIGSALGGALLSTLATADASCGASCMVFGTWTASAVFGLRTQRILPPRYRRYFLWQLLPYALLALASGVWMPTIDIWGHVGGAVSGALIALGCPPRLLSIGPPKPWRYFLVPCMIFAPCIIAWCMPNHATLAPSAFIFPGFRAQIPTSWNLRTENKTAILRTYGNDLDVDITFSLHPTTALSIDDNPLLKGSITASDVTGVRFFPSSTTHVAGWPGGLLHVETKHDHRTMLQTLWVVPAGVQTLSILARVPTWLADLYGPTFTAIVQSAVIVPTP